LQFITGLALRLQNVVLFPSGVLKNSGDRAATLTTRVTDLSSQSVSLEEKGSSLGFELPTCADGAFHEQQTQISFQS